MADNQRNDSFRLHESISLLRSFEEEIRGANKGFFALSAKSGSVTTLGNLMVSIDRELRRTVGQQQALGEIPIEQSLANKQRDMNKFQFVEALPREGQPEIDRQTEKEWKRSIAPVSLSEAGLELGSAEAGSGHFIFEAIGTLQGIMVDQPVTALVNAVTLLGGFTTLSVYLRHRVFSRPDFQDGMKKVEEI